MGGPKALMTVKGAPWWRMQEQRLTGIDRTWVVSHDVAAAMQDRAPPRVVGDGDAPMFDSVRAGLDHVLGAAVAGVFILPVDVPVPTGGTLRLLAAAAGSGVAVPCFQGIRGHPVALSRAWIDRIFVPATNAGRGQRLDRLIAADTIEVVVHDPDVAANLNTPEDLRGWAG